MKHRGKKPPATNRAPIRKLTFKTSFLPYIVIICAVIIYFWKIINSQNFLWEDILYQYYPFHYYLFAKLRNLTLPIWNPYMFAGMPFLADIQTQVFYPLNWILALISTTSQQWVYWLVEFKCILHILLGALGFYLLMRELKSSPFAGIISGITFAFSSFMVMHIIHLTLINTYAWLPLILLFFYRTLFNRKIQDALLAGIILGFANLAGHPQITLHIVYALGLLFIVYIILNWRREQIFIISKQLPLFILIILTGFALAACAYLPSYRYSLYTVRELMTFAESAELSLPPSFLLTMFIPKFFGSITATGTDTVQFWGNPANYAYWETAVYMGITPLILALIGIIFNPHKLRWHFAILALFALLFALGRFTPLYRLAFEFLPGFNRFRIPARFIGLVITAVAFFAGLGIDVLIKSRIPTRKVLLPGVCLFGYGVIILILLLSGTLTKIFPGLNDKQLFNNALNQSLLFVGLTAGSLLLIWLLTKYYKNARLFAALLIALAFVDLYQFGSRFNLGSMRPDEFYPRRPFIDQLIQENQKIPFRINARAGQYMILQRNEGLLWQLELLEGYTPLKLTDYVTFDIPQARKNNLLNAKYQIAVDSVNQTIRLTPNPSAQPRVWLADSCIIITDRHQILALLSEPDFDCSRVAVLEKKPNLLPIPDSMPAGSALIINRQPEELQLQVQLVRPAILMVSEVYYPEWQAMVDNKPVEILRADYCLRAIPLAAGTHTVKFYYDRGLINTGIIISILTLIGAVGFLIVTSRFKNKESTPRLTTREQSK
uniref:YfhO family protein n=1 Tax=candidate division WOR-3 bacterium TaxID=2052148 RepID=A0A7V3PSM2_UNCW3